MTYTDADVERVAEAIYNVEPAYLTYDHGDWLRTDFQDLDDDWKDEIREQARAALDAMGYTPQEYFGLMDKGT